jgi:hypothetical protein
MDIKIEIKELMDLLETVKFRGIPISGSTQYPEILKVSREIISYFGLPLIYKFEDHLIKVVYRSENTKESVEKILQNLRRAAAYCKSITQDDTDDNENFYLTLQENLDEPHGDECDITEEDDEILNRSLESGLRKFKEYEEQKKIMEDRKEDHQSIDIDDMKKYITDHLYEPLTDREFEDIEKGFRLRWNYSAGQMFGDGDFKQSVDQYLTSIESPINRKKTEKVVDLILEYLEEIGQWGEK